MVRFPEALVTTPKRELERSALAGLFQVFRLNRSYISHRKSRCARSRTGKLRATEMFSRKRPGERVAPFSRGALPNGSMVGSVRRRNGVRLRYGSWLGSNRAPTTGARQSSVVTSGRAVPANRKFEHAGSMTPSGY